MSRAHVTGLALVNWKGVFYERYRLDRHVTALEGANGAGKTTVMIAAYLVLLPDLSRVRFSNIGESGASGGDRGIWGRLGEPGRPSYAALDMQLPGTERIVVGVRLRRMSEPTVEASAFIVDRLPAELPLSELFLLRDDQNDQICELDEVKAAIKRAGGAIEVFRSVKDYFSALFERGITPLRLSSEEDRHKYNEMLRTSMTGGISRVLTTELRGFLLKEEGGLGDVLGRMRNNLDACRRTRGEVSESRAVERDISSVYEAGDAMFSNAYHAARSAAAEAERSSESARGALHLSERAARQLAAEVSELSSAEAAFDQQLTAAGAEHAAMSSRLDRLRAAAAVALKLRALDEELSVLDRQLEAARAAQSGAVEARGRTREQRDQARESYERAALGLANLQEGLDELHRRAHGHRELTRNLAEAGKLLERPNLPLAAIPNLLRDLRSQIGLWLSEKARTERDQASLAQRQVEQTRALGALKTLESALPVERPKALADRASARRATTVTEDTGSDRAPLPAGAAPSELAPAASGAALAEHASTVAEGSMSELAPAASGAALGERAVGDVNGAAVGVESALARARRVLSRFAEWEGELARLAVLEFERDEMRHLGARRHAAWGRARELGIPAGPGIAAALAERAEACRARLTEAGAQERAVRLQLEAAAGGLARARQEQMRLDRVETVWYACAAAKARISAVLGCELAQAGDLGRARERWVEENYLLSARRTQLQAERETSLQLARDLSGPGAALDPELIRLRDELNAELLLEHFDDVSAEEAAVLEARIGPLSQALLVPDPRATALALLDKPRTLDTLWLVRAGAELQPALLGEGREDVAVEQTFGARLTRRPAQPSLGAGARAARAQEQRERAESAAGSLEQLSLRIRDLASLQSDLELLSADPELSFAGDPTQARATLQQELDQTVSAQREAGDQLDAIAARSGTDRAQLDQLHRLTSELSLLETADPAPALARLDARIDRARSLQGQLAELEPARRELSDLLDVLRAIEPPDHPPADAATSKSNQNRASDSPAAVLTTPAGREPSGLPDALRSLAPSDVRTVDSVISIPTLGRAPGVPHDLSLATRAEVGAADEPRDGWRRKAVEFGLDAALEWGYRAAAALEQVLALTHAAEWQDALGLLDARAELVPSLKSQHERARQSLTAADSAVSVGDAAWERATALAQQAAADHASAAAQRDRLRSELTQLGGAADALRQDASDWPARDQPEAADDSLLSRAERAVLEAGERRAQLERRGRTLVASLSRGRERSAHAERDVERARSSLSAAEAAAEPVQRSWLALRRACEAGGLIASAPLAELESREFAAAAASRRALLLDRLGRSRGGEELAARLQDATVARAGGDKETESRSGAELAVQPQDAATTSSHAVGVRESGSRSGAELAVQPQAAATRSQAASDPDDPGFRALRAWEGVREWLRRRVPLQLAEADEPLRALGRLRDQLDVLERRLERQETDLRGASADVARGIEVQVRRARGQVRRLNAHLEGVRFGSISAIRVEMRRVERMEQILLALREGDAQELLFLPSLPIEEALDEIFKRYGGGRNGGQRLLDYREYLELAVEIKRQTGDTWEAASPTRLSTGEAIGVGAALMMVVLTEWERDAHLLRPRPEPGSLRFLFLDEANRLSRDNLGVLFELCRNLDLQLMIAAPEVARAEGNTTYRLVRQISEDGREEVIVSGRRAIADLDPVFPESDPSADLDTPASSSLEMHGEAANATVSSALEHRAEPVEDRFDRVDASGEPFAK